MTYNKDNPPTLIFRIEQQFLLDAEKLLPGKEFLYVTYSGAGRHLLILKKPLDDHELFLLNLSIPGTVEQMDYYRAMCVISGENDE